METLLKVPEYMKSLRETRLSAMRGPREFFDVQRISRPADLNQATSRISYNTRYFSGNYGVIVAILAVYALLTNYWLLISLGFLIGGFMAINKWAPEPMQVGDQVITQKSLYTGLFVIGIPLLWWSSPLGTFFWLVGSSAVLILGHAALMEPGVESEYANVTEMDTSNSIAEFQESHTVTLEWTVRNLKQLFESSRGEQKSKVVKSAIFGGGGHEGGGYISLYLSCEPTADEKEKAINGKWQREGLYKFTFELRSLSKNASFNIKEAYNHAFSWKTANWGWAQFAKRDTVYYAPTAVRAQDAFVIVCQITDSPASPTSTVSKQSVPRDLLGSVGSLLDDPCYSDVEFVLPPRRRGGKTRRIYASKKLLAGRAEYFQTMFSSGFAEATPDTSAEGSRLMTSFDESDYASAYSNAADDSDEEDAELDDMAWEVSSDAGLVGKSVDDPGASDLPAALVPIPVAPTPVPAAATTPVIAGPPKVPVVVRDVAYVTYKAFLYYLYTDTIVFAPLKSQFMLSSPSTSSFSQATLHLPTSSDGAPMHSPGIGAGPRTESAGGGRRGWLRDWEANNPDRPSPCSAKAIYRLADKLDLAELKARAFTHITKSLSILSVPFELFSSFSAAFSEVRKVQMDFALRHWNEIRSAESMKQVLSELRSGRYPGYEEVMPQLLGYLVYKPLTAEGTGDESGQEGMMSIGGR
ncbi:hypothetical protein CTheo_7444 [Ceratobasidium theobromae]|uniref:PRA1 family protein n=1 Tax=Ceratobasidium theobromae TaxID=1582974 RepID=A0A5N5QBJ0_9AGAM|nr:hypothetical protein CTheo_7444 [Ceratobasidium theobromae]